MKRILFLIVLPSILLLLSTCKKIEFATKVTTVSATPSAITIAANGQINDLSSSSHSDYGFCYGTAANPSVKSGKLALGTAKIGEFAGTIEGLTMGQQYYVRAYCKDGDGYIYGESKSVTTLVIALPTIATTAIFGITTNSATSGGNVTSVGGAAMTERGICYSKTTNPTIASSKIVAPGTSGVFSISITGLTPNTLYYVRAYASTSVGTAYGSEVSFTTNALAVPTLTTTAATAIAQTTATSGGNVTSDGGVAISERGICYSLTTAPTTASTKVTATGTTGAFTSSLTGLTPVTTYYVRAYATNNLGTAYGNEITLTTLALSVPILTTTDVTSITNITATSGGSITSNGGAIITVSGVCWSTNQNPTISLTTKTTDNATSGTYTSSITGLTPGTTYYVRAYATNSVGTAYGTQVSFTTSPVVPTLTTTAATSITTTTATSGGNVTSDGGAAVTGRGICYSTTQNPTTASSKVTATGNTGAFTSNITGLTEGTTYYVRAYATNSVGTAYGNEMSFTTSPVVPTLTTTAISEITATTATSGGTITFNGGAAVTVSGVCWSTTANPTVADSKTTDGALTGTYISSITGLTVGTLYHVRAYATNSVGTAYGADVTFTVAVVPTITTTSISAITATNATSGGTITSIGGAAVTVSGVCWSTVANPTVADSKTTDGTLTGTYTSSITGLTGGTIYHVRAYATNSVGTAYGANVTFTTSAAIVPSITTTVISAITSTTATSGGTIISNGGAAITTSGVCWSTSANPTTALSTKTTDGTTTGTFTSSITGLTIGTLYHVRAYATNSAGTAYGVDFTFTSTLTIGETYAGGIVFYIDGTGLHGLVCAPTNQSSSATWGCSGTAIVGADGTNVGTGNQNTTDIVNGCTTASIAAKICYNLVLNGYSDWYLPSKDELNLMYTKLKVAGFGSFTTPGDVYWSSSESNSTYSWFQNFYDLGKQATASKDFTCYVRAVRSF